MVTCIVLDSEGLGSIIMVLIEGEVIYREKERDLMIRTQDD